MHAVRALLFDFNGTLSHDEPLLCAIYRELFAAHGRPLTEQEYYDRLAGLSEEAIVGGWLGVDGDELRALVAERIERYRAVAADGETVPAAVREAVRFAAARVPVGVVSGAFRAEIEPVLAGSALAGVVSLVVAADDVVDGKPHPAGYLRAVEALGLPPGAVAAFEDTEAGVAAAKAAGVRCLAVRGTLSPERLAAADELVDEIDVELVRRLLA
jgi:beta-phosphoglucomutase-like phosphatase (HAD superfamily)